MAYHEGSYSGGYDQNSWQGHEPFNDSDTVPVDYGDRPGIRYQYNNRAFEHSTSENIRQYSDDPAEDYSRHAGDGRVEYRGDRGHDSHEARNYDHGKNRGFIPPDDEDFQRFTDSKRHHGYRGQDGYIHQGNGNFRQEGNWNSFDFKGGEEENVDDWHLNSGERYKSSRSGFIKDDMELNHIETSDEEYTNRDKLHQRSIRRISNRTKTLIRKRSKFNRKSDFVDTTFRGARRSTVKKGTLPSYQRDQSMTLQQKLDLLHQQNSTHDVAKFFRDQIVKDPVEKLKGFSAWRQRQYQSWQKFKWQAKSMVYQLEPWAGALKSVEGQFGSSIMSYFRFVRWLMFLNLYMSIVMVSLTLVPHLALSSSPAKFEDPYQNLIKKNVTNQENEAVNCSLQYQNYLEQKQENIASKVLDFLQGTGWMEHTVLFYGVYFNKTYPLDGAESSKTYNMCLSYLLATGAAFLISFVLIVRK